MNRPHHEICHNISFANNGNNMPRFLLQSAISSSWAPIAVSYFTCKHVSCVKLEWQKLDKNLVQIIIEFYFIQHQKMTAVRLWLRELKFKTGLSVKLVMSRKGCPSSRWQRAICSENSFKIFHTQWKRITCLSGMKPASGITKPDTLLCLAANSSFGGEEAKFNNENWRELQDNLDLESQRITCILKCLS